jgi:ankyrin repeat protein
MLEPAIFSKLRALDSGSFFSRERLDLTVRGTNGQTLLHEAIAFAKQEVAEGLITLGIDLNAQNKKGQTALHYALIYKNVPIVKKLLSQDVDVNVVDIYGNGPLWTATLAANGDYEVVTMLLTHGANPRHKNKAGRSVVDFAMQSGDTPLLKLCGGA